MSVEKVYTLENEIGTRTRFSATTSDITDSSVGICVALSSLWCHNVIKLGMGQSRPDYLRASLLQGIYERAGDIGMRSSAIDLRPIFDNLELKVTSLFQMRGNQAIHYLRSLNGVYMLRYPGHSMAAQVGTNGYYFLDPEEGLFHCSSGSAFESQVWKLYGTHKSDMWTCQAVVSA